jgi:hypothetical protein
MAPSKTLANTTDGSSMIGTAIPLEARVQPPLPLGDSLVHLAVKDVIVAVNGFVYAGVGAESIIAALQWLRTHPEHARIILNTDGEQTN